LSDEETPCLFGGGGIMLANELNTFPGFDSWFAPEIPSRRIINFLWRSAIKSPAGGFEVGWKNLGFGKFLKI
jgi:hypothetical protein